MIHSNLIQFGAYKDFYLACCNAPFSDLSKPHEKYNKKADLSGLIVHTYRRKVCEFSCAVVCHIMKISRKDLCHPTRLNAEAALARQVAMYVAHVGFSQSQRAVGIYFKRDRTTVAHACRIVEDMRDNKEFDQMMCKIELIINAAKSGFEALLDMSDGKEPLL